MTSIKEIKTILYDVAIIICLLLGIIFVLIGFFLCASPSQSIQVPVIEITIEVPPLVGIGIALLGLAFKFGKEEHIQNNKNNHQTEVLNRDKAVKRKLLKTLRKFDMEWKQLTITDHIKFFELSRTLYDLYKNDILDILSEDKELLSKPVQEKLRKMADILEEGKWTVEGIGNGPYDERKEAGDKAHKLALEIISELEE